MHDAAPLFVFVDDVGPEDIGRHQIRGALDAPRSQSEHLGERLHEERFSETGNPFEEDVSSRKDSHESVRKQFIIADNGLLDLCLQGVKPVSESLQILSEFVALSHIKWFNQSS